MREAIDYLKQDRVLKFAFISSSIFFLCQVIFLGLSFSKLPPLVPLYLQRPWGEAQIASKAQIFILPAITASLIIANTLLGVAFYKNNTLVARILLWGQALLSFLSTAATIKIVLLVI